MVLEPNHLINLLRDTVLYTFFLIGVIISSTNCIQEIVDAIDATFVASSLNFVF